MVFLDAGIGMTITEGSTEHAKEKLARVVETEEVSQGPEEGLLVRREVFERHGSVCGEAMSCIDINRVDEENG